jgi:hypothetical protein
MMYLLVWLLLCNCLYVILCTVWWYCTCVYVVNVYSHGGTVRSYLFVQYTVLVLYTAVDIVYSTTWYCTAQCTVCSCSCALLRAQCCAC